MINTKEIITTNINKEIWTKTISTKMLKLLRSLCREHTRSINYLSHRFLYPYARTLGRLWLTYELYSGFCFILCYYLKHILIYCAKNIACLTAFHLTNLMHKEKTKNNNKKICFFLLLLLNLQNSRDQIVLMYLSSQKM